MKKILKKSITIIAIILLIFMIIPIGKSKAVFTAADCPYPINIVDIQVSSYQAMVLALDENGSMWSWGTNDCGQLGLGNTTVQTIPRKIDLDKKIVKIETGNKRCIALDEDGHIWAWGENLRKFFR